MPFFKLKDMPEPLVAPGYSDAYGPTITSRELELGYYAEPKGAGSRPHRHPSEQLIMVLTGRLRMRIDEETRDLGPGEVALILGNQEHEQEALEDGTRFVSFKTAAGAQPVNE